MSTESKPDDIRVGDEFEIRVRVTDVPKEKHVVRVDILGSPDPLMYLSMGSILSGRRIPRPLAVGDRVRLKDSPQIAGRLDALSGDEVWVKFDIRLDHETRRLGDLEPAPASEKETP